MYKHIQVEKSDNLCIIRLDRPQTYNAFNGVMAAELQDILSEVDIDSSVRAVMITGEGKAFSSGQDLADIEDLSDVPFDRILDEQYNPVVRMLSSLAKPTIAYVNGVAAGAGANLALLCDIIVASEAASFIQAFANIGLVPDTGGTWMLPKIVGHQRAMALMITGEKISALQAQEWGMVYKVWPADVAAEEARSMAMKIAQMPTRALMETKKLIHASYSRSLEDQIELEKESQIRLGASHDFAEGVKAFLEKRKPQFRGE